MNTYLLTENQCPTLIYGVIKTNLTEEELQNAIREVKAGFTDEEFSNYTIEDVINELLNKGFDLDYIITDGSVNI